MSDGTGKSLESRLDRHLIACAAVAAGIGAVAIDRAQASVVYTNPPDISVDETSYTGFYLNFVSGGNSNGLPGPVDWDVNIFAFSFFGQPDGQVQTQNGGAVVGRVVGYPYADRLAAVGAIGPGSAFLTSTGGTIIYGNPAISPTTSWRPGDTGYLGIRLTEGGNTFFGWLQLHVDPFNPATGLYPMTILDWAYENSPNTAIVAGDTGAATPEPGAMSLALLSLGAIGTRRWRGVADASAN